MTKEALKLALEALQHEADKGNDDAYKVERDAIKEALAQPEQEPFMASYEFKQYGYYKDGKGTLKLGNIPATQPPQRTWVGLTADEMEGLYQLATYMDETDYIHMLMMAEAKLKEKNT